VRGTDTKAETGWRFNDGLGFGTMFYYFIPRESRPPPIEAMRLAQGPTRTSTQHVENASTANSDRAMAQLQ